jgi:DNA-binding MarR family transcriptional regulator
MTYHPKDIATAIARKGNIRLFLTICETGGSNLYRLSRKSDVTYAYTVHLINHFIEAGLIDNVKRGKGTRNGCYARNREVVVTEKGRKLYNRLKEISLILNFHIKEKN